MSRILLRRIRRQPERQLGERRIEKAFQRQHRDQQTRITIPNHVQFYFLEVGISIMRVGFPSRGIQIDLNVTCHGRLAGELQHRVAEIRPRAVIPETRMQHAHRPAIGELQFIAKNALMMPDVLEQRFGRRILIPQRSKWLKRRAPLEIELRAGRKHSDCL